MKVTIERHRWDRGQGRHRSIADAEGNEIKRWTPEAIIPNPTYQCCVGGFVINSSGSREQLGKKFIALHDLFVDGKAIDINDDSTITDEVREQRMKEEFAKFGHEVEFVD